MDPVRCPCNARAGPTRKSPMFFISYGTRRECETRKGAVRHLYGHLRELTQPEFAKIPHGCRMWPHGARTGPLRSPHGPFTDCLRSLNPNRTRKLIMHASKLCGLVQGGNIPTARTDQKGREQPVRGPGVWSDWGIRNVTDLSAKSQLDDVLLSLSRIADVLAERIVESRMYAKSCKLTELHWNKNRDKYSKYRPW